MRTFALILICFTLLFAACSTEPLTEDSIENTTEDNITIPVFEDEDEIIVVENETETIVLGDANNNTFIEWEEPVSRDEFFTVTGLATRAGTNKFAINRLLIETNSEIDETVFLEVKINGIDTTYDLDTDIDCTSDADMIKNRNEFYGVSMANETTTLCFSPARDMYEYNELQLVIKNDYEETLFNHTVTAPRLLRSTQTVPLYSDE